MSGADEPCREAALRAVRAASEAELRAHAGAVAWREALDFPAALVWLPRDWAAAPEQAAARRVLIPPRPLRRIEAALTAQQRARGLAYRALHAASDRLAMPVAAEEVLGVGYWVLPNTQYPTPNTCLSHTPLGQPIVRGGRGLRVSFSHDGEAHLTLCARAQGLRGVGIDVVHLPRLRAPGKDAAYLHRFARHFMSADEYALFAEATRADDEDALRRRVAAHFSLMEAASKALGTGLLIGAGMGRLGSLPKQSLGVETLDAPVRLLLDDAARRRCAALRARRLTPFWSADDEYLVSAVFLWRGAAGA